MDPKKCEWSQNKGGQKFACVLGSFLLFMTIIFNYLNFSWSWVLVGLVSAFSLLAGATNFCLGSLLFVWFRSLFLKGKEHECK